MQRLVVALLPLPAAAFAVPDHLRSTRRAPSAWLGMPEVPRVDAPAPVRGASDRDRATTVVTVVLIGLSVAAAAARRGTHRGRV